ncbi:MAG TPA: hypothetical protein PLX79_01545 [Candidatus Dojkabacteria bacterium]|nr:hypothetical protein [Candidatus Dojkabacteria bacterium]
MSHEIVEEQLILKIANKIISSKKYADIDDEFIICLVKSFSTRYPTKLLEDKVRGKLHQIRGAYFSESLFIEKILNKFPYLDNMTDDNNPITVFDFINMLDYIILQHSSTKERAEESDKFWSDTFDIYGKLYDQKITKLVDLGCGVNFLTYIKWLLINSSKSNKNISLGEFQDDNNSTKENRPSSDFLLSKEILKDYLVDYYEGWDIGKSELEISEFISRYFLEHYSGSFEKHTDQGMKKSFADKDAFNTYLFSGIASDVMKYPVRNNLLTNIDIANNRFDCVLLLKVLQNLEQVDKGNAIQLLKKIDTNLLVVSFPTRSLGGKTKDMDTNYSSWFEGIISESDYQIYEQTQIGSDIIFYCVKRQNQS